MPLMPAPAPVKNIGTVQYKIQISAKLNLYKKEALSEYDPTFFYT
jgi:hypothetical protein